MSRIADFPARRTAVRAAVLDLVGQNAEASGEAIGPEEAEFLAALRRIVSRTPAQDLWDKYHGSRSDGASRIFHAAKYFERPGHGIFDPRLSSGAARFWVSTGLLLDAQRRSFDSDLYAMGIQKGHGVGDVLVGCLEQPAEVELEHVDALARGRP